MKEAQGICWTELLVSLNCLQRSILNYYILQQQIVRHLSLETDCSQWSSLLSMLASPNAAHYQAVLHDLKKAEVI